MEKQGGDREARSAAVVELGPIGDALLELARAQMPAPVEALLNTANAVTDKPKALLQNTQPSPPAKPAATKRPVARKRPKREAVAA